MEAEGGRKEKGRSSKILRTIKQYRSNGHQRTSSTKPQSGMMQWVAPEGYLFVYVGAEKKRFMIRTECVNRPLFRLLLDQAETEFGFSGSGPIELPCDVEIFHRAMREMEQEVVDASWCSVIASTMHGSAKGHGGYGVYNKFTHIL